MAIMRIKNRLSASSPAPPPSPIPTAKGSRSAADSAFSTYLDKTKLVPELNLPDYIYRSVIADVDYSSLKSRDPDSVDSVRRSARDSGVFRISNHGIQAEELRLTLTGEESGLVGLMADSCRRFDDREEFLWRRSAVTAKERGKRVAGAQTYRSFSKIENAATKLEAIAEELTQIIASHRSTDDSRRVQLNESRLSLCRHNNGGAYEYQNSPLLIKKSREYVWSLHLPLDHGEFCIKSSKGGPLSFNTSSETIVVTVGELLEEWSLGELKSAYGELSFEPDLQGSQPSFSIELKCSPSKLNLAFDDKRITIANQVFVILFLILLYRLFTFIFA